MIQDQERLALKVEKRKGGRKRRTFSVSVPREEEKHELSGCLVTQYTSDLQVIVFSTVQDGY